MKSWKLILTIAILTVLSTLAYSSAYALQGCCEKTTSGLYCTTSEDTECEPGANFAPTACEQTSYCKLGCCYSSESGRCFKSTPKAACAKEGNSTWQESQNCEIPQCQKGCCTIGNQASYVTDVRCKRTAAQYEGAAFTFDNTVKSESDCIDKARSQETGCCVTDNGCSFTTRNSCTSSTSEVVTANASRVGFHKDTLCSNDKLNCGCAKQSTTACFNEDVYWVDSCGNKENIYSADKRASYNDGLVLKEEQSCRINSAGDTSCGNCDYNTGTLCGTDTEKEMPVGSVTCVGVNCADTYEDSVSPNAGGDKKNGESWCVYDTLPGQARDVVGSRHYRHLCINGEEITEPCKDFRDELCIQGAQGGEVLRNLLALQSAFSDEQYVEAACRENRNNDCNACNTLEQEFELNAGVLERRKACCEDETLRDCYWLPSSLNLPTAERQTELGFSAGSVLTGLPSAKTTSSQPLKDLFGTCVAQVPQGLKFWGDASAAAATASSPNSATPGNGAPTATTPSSEAAQACSVASTECKVEYQRSGLCRGEAIGKFVKALLLWSTDCDWKIMKNEQCTKHDWIVAGNNICKSMGDCGAYYNIQGKITKDGYVNTAVDEKTYFTGKPLTDAEVADYGKLVAKSREKGFMDRDGTTSMIVAGAGILFSGVYAGAVNGDWEKIGNGLNPLQSTILGGIGSGNFIGQVFTGSLSGSTILSVIGDYTCTGTQTPQIGARPTSAVNNPQQRPAPNTNQQSSNQQTQPQSTEESASEESEFQLSEPELNVPRSSPSLGVPQLTRPSGEAVAIDSVTGDVIAVTGAQTAEGPSVPIVEDTPPVVRNTETAQQRTARLEREEQERQHRETASNTNVPAGQHLNTQLRSLVRNGDQCSSAELTAMRTALAGKDLLFGSGGSDIVKPSMFGEVLSVANTYFWLQAIANLIDIAFTKNVDRTYKIECKPWQPPLGGDDCEKCNEPFKPCSEYRCKALGSTCELVNKGTSNESCISMDVNDVNSPIVNPNYQVLTPPFTLQEVTEEGNKGYRINERIKPFRPVELGIAMDEPAQCKYDITPGKRFDQMSQQFGSSLYLYNQSLILAVPAELAQSNVTKVTNGEFAFYIRCQDGRGNKNERDYFIKFQVDPTPDLTPPVIRYTSIQNNGFISNNVTELDLSVYVDEPADCHWSRLDTGFEVMEKNFTCTQDPQAMSSLYGGTFKCDTRLTGLQNKKNELYVRCKDKPTAPNPSDRIPNEDSYVFTLTGTDALKITSSGPEGKQYSKKVLMAVTTTKGAENGKATCGFSINNVPFQQMIIFANSNADKHEQLFTDQQTGEYKYFIKCQDIGGNEDSAIVNFTVDVDTSAPEITGLYADSLFRVIHVDLNEASTCESRPEPGFRLGEGTPLGNANSTSIEANYRPEQPEPLYMMCTDVFGNTGEYSIVPSLGE